MFGLRFGELLIILAVFVLLFGATKLPQLGSSLGQAIRNFKRGFGEGGDEVPEPNNKKDVATLPAANATEGKATASKVGSRDV